MADAELVALARSGDKSAFGQLIERYQQMVKRIALRMIADEDIARELAQEAILQAYLSLDHLRDSTRFKSWLYGITLNICRSHLQDWKADVLSLETVMGGIHSDRVTFFDDIVDPQSATEEHELHHMVMHAIHGLSAKD